MQHKILTSTLVNIDSSFRNINPKNIYISNNKTANLIIIIQRRGKRAQQLNHYISL